MRRLQFSLMMVALVLISSPPASADWAKNLITAPPAGTTVPASIKMNSDYFYFIAATTSDDSSWIWLPGSMNVDICLDNDVASAAIGTSTLTADVLVVPHNNGKSKPTDLTGAFKLLGITLDGTPSAGGVTNDCFYDLKGPLWLLIGNIVVDANQDGLLSISHRKF